MLISQEMNQLMNEQIGHEFGASLQYVSIASYFDTENLSILADHFYKQAEEERDHAMRFVKFVANAGGRVVVPAIPAPKPDYASAEEAVGLSLEWEKKVTEQINQLMDLAVRQRDHISHSFLEWFATEQLEEVSSMERLLSLVKRAGNNLLLVEELLTHGAQRPSTPAAT